MFSNSKVMLIIDREGLNKAQSVCVKVHGILRKWWMMKLPYIAGGGWLGWLKKSGIRVTLGIFLTEMGWKQLDFSFLACESSVGQIQWEQVRQSVICCPLIGPSGKNADSLLSHWSKERRRFLLKCTVTNRQRRKSTRQGDYLTFQYWYHSRVINFVHDQ